MEEVRCRALTLIENQIDLFAAAEELDDCSLASEEEAWLDILRSRSLSLGVAPSFLAVQLVTRALKQSSDEDYSKIQSVVKRIKHLQHQRLFDGSHFVETLLRDLKSLPVGALVCLLESNLIPAASLLSKPTAVMVDYLRPILCNGDGPLLNGLAKWIMHESYIMGCCEAKKLLLSLVNECYYSTEAWRDYSLLDAVKIVPALPSSLLCELHCDVLMDLLTNRGHLSVCEVISCQDNWCFCRLPSNVISLHTRLVEAIPSGTVIEVVNQALTLKLLNWPALLEFVSCYVTSSSEAAHCLKEYAVGLSRKSIEKRECIFFQSSLLLARQAALHGSHVHPAYPTWFQSLFGQSNILSTKKAREFVFSSLSELVPYEPAYSLQAHTTPPLLQLANNVSGDYRMLVQTRLQDLSLADNGHSSDQQPPQHVIEDVKNAVEEYREKGGVPDKLNFISCFKRPYFIGQFLPTLLSSSESISQLPGRDALVTALKSKIPRKMYEVFNHSKNSCLAGGAKEEGLSSEQLSYLRITELLQKLLLVKGGEASYKLVSQLSNVLKDVVPSQLVPTCDVLSLTSPGLLPLHVKIVDAMLNALCELMSSNDCQGNKVQLCLEMFSGHLVLHKAFLVRLWELISAQITQLSHDQLIAVARLSSVFWFSHYDLSALTIQENTSTLNSAHPTIVKTMKEYCECIILCSLPLCSHTERTASRLFCCCFISHCIELLNQGASSNSHTDSPLLPDVVLAKFKYLLSRMPDDPLSYETMNKVSEHEQLNVLCDSSQVDFTQWLIWELSVEDDHLLPCQRESYLRSTLYDHYLPLASQLGGLGGSLCSAVRQLFVALVEHDETPSYNMVLSLFQTVCMSGSQEVQCHAATMIVDAALHYLSHTMEKTMPLQSILNVFCSIPPWLMFSDGPTAQLGCLNSVAECLRQLMSISDSYLLPSSLVHHVCKGMKAFSNGSSLFEQLLQLSVLFEASLIVGWPSLSNVVTSSISYSSSHSWLHGDLSQACPRHLRSVVLGVCFYHTLSELTSNHQAIWLVIQNISNVTLKEEILAVMVDCCARHTTEEVLYDLPTDSPLLSLAKNCVSMYPGALDACFIECNCCKLYNELLGNLRFEFFCREHPHLLPLFLLRLLMSLSEVELKQVIEFHPSFLSLCLSAHSHYMESHCAQVMEPGFLQQCTRLAEQFIVQTPHCEMQEAAQLKCHSTLKPFLERKLHPCVSKV